MDSFSLKSTGAEMPCLRKSDLNRISNPNQSALWFANSSIPFQRFPFTPRLIKSDKMQQQQQHFFGAHNSCTSRFRKVRTQNTVSLVDPSPGSEGGRPLRP